MMEKILPLIERMYIFLEDGNWNKANEYCERILDLSPKNTDAYIGKLMIDYKINQISNFENCKKSFENNVYYACHHCGYGRDLGSDQGDPLHGTVRCVYVHGSQQRRAVSGAEHFLPHHRALLPAAQPG